MNYKIYLRALVACALYGVVQAACGLLMYACASLRDGGSMGAGEAFVVEDHPVELAVCLLLSTVVAVALVWLCLRMIRPGQAFSLPRIGWKAALTGLVGGVAAAASINIMSELAGLTDNNADLLLAVVASPLGVVVTALVAPLGEELVFREGIQGFLMRRGAPVWGAIVVSSLLFGLLHLNPVQTFFASLMGLVLGVLYCRTGSVLLCSALHVLNNTAAATQMVVMGPASVDYSLCDALGGRTVAVAVMAASLLLGVACLWLFWRMTSPRD